MIDQFTKDRFEEALPDVPRDEPTFVKGEWVYTIPVFRLKNGECIPTNKRLVVRSSLDRSGVAAVSGADSIRHWVEYEYKGRWYPLAKAGKAYTTRVAGWEQRLTDALRELWRIALDDDKKAPANPAIAKPTTPAVDSNETAALLYPPKPTSLLDLKQKESAPATLDPFAFLGDEEQLVATPEPESLASSPHTQPPAVIRTPNASQKAAIEADIHTPLRVLAPPGSGKTFVMALRYAYLLAQGVEPEHIVAVTFNRTMADELLARIARVNPRIAEMLESNPTAAAVQQITTIHALCYRILRAEGDKRSVPDKDGRVKPWQVRKAWEDIIAVLWPVVDKRPGWQEVESVVYTAKGQGLDSQHDMELFGSICDKFGNNIGQELHLARQRFDEWCQRQGVIQFPDMLYEVDVRLRDDPAFKLRWQTKFHYVLVDEAQDTSAQAMRILTTLAAPQDQITVVGDTDQLLYRFTGATPEANLYDGFEQRYPDGQMIILEVNYRSTQEIINRCSRLISHNYGVGRPYDAKYLKTVQARPGAPQGEPVTFTMCEDAVEEAQHVAQHIKQLLDKGRKPDEIFVGVRTCAQTGYLEGPFVQAGIPYINLVGQSFFGLKHVADVVSYIALAADEGNSEAFQQVYNIASAWNVHPWGESKGQYCPHRYLGAEFIKECYDSVTKKPQYKWRWSAVRKRRSWTSGVEDLEALVVELQARLAEQTVSEVLAYLVEEHYQKYLRSSEGLLATDAAADGKLDDLVTLQELAQQFGSDVSAFLAYVKQARETAEQAAKGDWSGHVVISTIHRLKGLERPIVFGLGWVEGTDKQGRVVGLLPHTYSMRPAVSQGMIALSSQGRIEDERDIAFVLVSRAQEECHLTGCAVYRQSRMWPCRFVYEMGLLERDEDVDENGQDDD